ncbi:hypothetical protein MBANPS3_005696 [Mucor bainieri]
MSVAATASTPTKERQAALSTIAENKKAIVELRTYQDVIKPKANVGGRTESSKRAVGLALNRTYLPKFQLAYSAVKALPNEEVFESVEHYFSTFESILNSSALDLETHWAKLLPLCMPNGDRVWVDKTLLKCSSWWEAKQVFKRRFGSAVVTHRNTNLLSDPREADCFMVSLILPIGRRGQGSYKCADTGGVSKKFRCEQHGANDTHNSKDCQFLKFKKARAEGKCVKCWKSFEKGHDCGGRCPLGVGPSNTALNHEVFATSMVSAQASVTHEEGGSVAAVGEDADSVIYEDQLVRDLAFECAEFRNNFENLMQYMNQ